MNDLHDGERTLDTSLVRRDSRALDAHATLEDGLGGLERDLVVGLDGF